MNNADRYKDGKDMEAAFALSAVSPIDGRYMKRTQVLSEYFSERALIRNRAYVEVAYLIALAKEAENGVIKIPGLSEAGQIMLEEIIETPGFAELVKAFEKETNHDVKAVEYALCKIMAENDFPKELIAHCHFALTSEDVNNLAYAVALHGSNQDVMLEQLDDVINSLYEHARTHADAPMMARTHGQPATPTTFGKEMMIFIKRLKNQTDQLREYKIAVKLNGASGNYNGHYAAYPAVDWPQFTYRFIKESFKDRFRMNVWTNQIEDHDTYAEFFAIYSRINVILKKLCKDFWYYISLDLIGQKKKRSEVGSSAMPHKINPIDFENAEGNLNMANALFEVFCRELPDSRMQRHLSDSTMERNIGAAFGHCLIAYASIVKGLEKAIVNTGNMYAELDAHPELLAEAYQLVLKKNGIDNAYELMKGLTRGNQMTLTDMHRFLDTVDIPEWEKDELRVLTPANYLGYASKLAGGFDVIDVNYTLKEM